MRIEWKANENALNSISQAIGRTPLVKLNQATKDASISASVYGKCDFLNPSGSLKDRVYYRIIMEAINIGSLKKGMDIIEVSTGNAGIACTWIGTMLGFNVTIIMPEGMSHERKEIIRQLGGKIIETPGAESDVDLSYEKAKRIVNENPQKYWFPDQYTNLDAIAAHYETTAVVS